MSKDKFLESIPKLSDFAFNDNAVLSAYNDIEDVYQTYIRHTNKHVYRYFYVAAGYLLNTACSIMKKHQTSHKPNLQEVLEYTQEMLLCRTGETHVYPDGSGEVQEIIQSICSRHLPGDLWEKLVALTDKYDDSVFKAVVLMQPVVRGLTHDGYSVPTPEGINKLALQILDIQNGDRVMDLGCGTAGFMVEMFKNDKLARYVEDGFGDAFPGGKYYGYEIATEEYEVAVLRANLLGAHYIDRDIMNVDGMYVSKMCDTRSFDKIFADYPRGIRYEYHYIDGNKMSSDWMFNDWICNHLSSNGKAVAIMSNGSAWNNQDIKTRERFVKSGLIEAVIALPEGLYGNTGVAVTMVVFSRDNKRVRLVDATKIVTQEKPCNRLSDENITKIVMGLRQNTDYSKVVDIKDLEENDYVLNYGRYVAADIKFENGQKLGNLIKSIRRGVLYKNTGLSSNKTNTTVDVQYLTLADIKNGIIDDELQYLDAGSEYEKSVFIDKLMKKKNFFVKKNDLIISKSGEPYKIAVADPKPGQKIVPSVNLYVIELDTSRIDPYYVKVFFESQRGKALLNSRSNHATMVNISQEELQKIEIPVPSLEVQKKIKNAYLAAADEYQIYFSKMNDVINRLNSIFDDNCEELKCF